MSDEIVIDGVLVRKGAQFSRWTVVRLMAPAHRGESDTGRRRRVYCRCVCGIEKAVWVQDIRAGRSSGCNSASCLQSWRARMVLAERIEGGLMLAIRQAVESEMARAVERVTGQIVELVLDDLQDAAEEGEP